jgi:hypothetical protein
MIEEYPDDSYIVPNMSLFKFLTIRGLGPAKSPLKSDANNQKAPTSLPNKASN